MELSPMRAALAAGQAPIWFQPRSLRLHQPAARATIGFR
jgi:hypothetical protein